MRVIKFRFWKDNKMQGILTLEKGGTLDMPWEWDTVDQFTGLLDKSGKEIYEGDIILATIIEDVLPSGETSEFTEKRVVEWNESQAGFAFAEDKYEVIGNIYESPELLK